MNGFAHALHLIGGEGAAPLLTAVVRVAAESGLDPVLVDLDPWAGGSDVLLGLEHVPGVRWHDLDGADGEFDADGLRDRLPTGPFGERVLAHDRWAARPVPDLVVRAALHALRLSAGVVIIDGARPTDLAQLHRAGDRIWIAVGDDVRSSAAGVVAAQWFSRHGLAHGTVLLQHGGGDPDGLPQEFAQIGRRVRIGRSELRDLERGVLCGRRRSSLRAQALRMLDELRQPAVAA